MGIRVGLLIGMVVVSLWAQEPNQNAPDGTVFICPMDPRCPLSRPR